MKRLAPMNILLVGNNPLELSDVYNQISSFKKGLLKTTVLFDLKKIKQHIKNLNPSAIFIDDKYSTKELSRAISRIHGSEDTHHIPITLMKSTNRSTHSGLEVDDFLLKTNLTGSSIYASITNGRRFRKSRIYFNKAYRKRKGQLKDLRVRVEDLFN